MKAIFLSILFLVAATAQGDTQSELRASKAKLNTSSPNAAHEAKLGSLVVDKSERVLRAVYDYSVLGGTVSTLTLRDASDLAVAAKLPKGAIIRDCIIDTITTPAGAAASLSLGYAGSATALKASTAGASFSGLVACTPVGSAATAIKLTSDAAVQAVVNGTVTAGKLYVIIHYELSDTL